MGDGRLHHSPSSLGFPVPCSHSFMLTSHIDCCVFSQIWPCCPFEVADGRPQCQPTGRPGPSVHGKPPASPGTLGCLLWLADISEGVISQIRESGPHEPPASRWQGGLASEVGVCPRPLRIQHFLLCSNSDRFPGGGRHLDCNPYLSAEPFTETAGLSTWTI